MKNNAIYKFDEFIIDLNKYESGWITWETRKSYHLDKKIREYIDDHFIKYSGDGVNDTNVNVYYYNKQMLN